MRLLYSKLIFSKKYHGFDQDIEMNFSREHSFSFEMSGCLRVEQLSAPVPDDFWGEKLYGVSFFVGDNGVGKSTIIHTLMRLLRKLNHREKIVNADKTLENALLMFEIKIDNEKNEYIVAEYEPEKGFAFYEGEVKENGETKLIWNQGERIALHENVEQLFFSNMYDSADICNDKADENLKNYTLAYLLTCDDSLYQKHSGFLTSVDEANQQEWKKQVAFVSGSEIETILEEHSFIWIPEELTIELTMPEAKQSLFTPLQDVLLKQCKKQRNELNSGEFIQLFLLEEAIHSLWVDLLNFLAKAPALHEDMPDEIAIQNLIRQIHRPDLNKTRELSEFVSAFFLYVTDYMKTRMTEDCTVEQWYQYVQQGFAAAICFRWDIFKDLLDDEHYTDFFNTVEQNPYLQRCLMVLFLQEQKGKELAFRQMFKFDELEWENNGEELVIKINTRKVSSENRKDIHNLIQVAGSSPNFKIRWGMSTGEESLLRTFSNLYHFAKNEHNPDCRSLYIFWDEIDAGFHPEWQRKMLASVVSTLRIIFESAKEIEDIQIFATTHSPLMLSDIPSNSVTYLRRKGNNSSIKNSSLNTFGQNLYTILKEGFFLEQSIGPMAEKCINTILEKEGSKPISNKEREELLQYAALFNNLYREELKRKIYSIPVVQQNNSDEQEGLDKKIAELEKKLQELKKRKEAGEKHD